MKRFTTYFLLLLTFILCSTGQLLAGAAYPVQLNAQIMPPYTNCLGDLVADNVSRIRVTALLRDMNMKSYNVGIGMKVYQGSQLKFSTMNNHTELVTPNTLHTFNVKDLFTPANVVGRYDGDGYCLKEGGYEFVFQAYDGGNAQLPLSEPVRFFAYLSQAEPPRPIAPANGECVSYNAPVNFVWMEGAVTSFNPNRSYRIEIFELPENMEKTDAKSFISTSSTKFTIDNIPGNLNFYTFQNTAGKLVKGRKYLWRVQLYDKTQQVSDGREVYSSSSMVANGGYSEVYSFSFNNCDPFGKQEENLVDDSKKPILIRVDSSEAQSTVVWKKEPDKYPYGYVVCFNTADDTLSNWAKVEVGPEDSSYTFKNVSTGVRYLTHIIGIVDQKEDGTKTMSANSDRGSFTMPVPVEQECSKTIDAVTSKWSIASLNPGNYITANDRNIKITEVTQTISGNDTLYSGKGVVLCPWMPTVSLITKFENVKINRNFELIKGMVYVPTDKSNCLFVDLDEWTNDQYKGTGPAETQKTSIPEYQSVDQIPEGELGVVDGKLYANEDGKAAYIGKVESADNYNKNVIQSNGLDADHGLVRFEHISNWNPPMDGERGEGYYGDVSDYYTTLSTLSDNYSVPWFAMVEGKTKSIKGEISLGRETANDVKFVCLVGDQAIVLDAKFDGNYTYTIPIFGGTGETSLDVYALATGANGDNLTLGHARIQNMPKMDQKVILIPVKREPGSIAKDEIEKQLNAIYGPLGITYKVEVADKFDGEDLSFLDDGLDVTTTSNWTTSSDEMKRLKNLYAQNHTIDEQAAYIFVCPKATYEGTEVVGDMPRCSQVGYVFSEAATYNDGWTIAHELGHGLYSFEHVFTKEKNKGNTNNLMDYNNGTILKVWQWNLLYSHKNFTIPFLEKDEDGMYNQKDDCFVLKKIPLSYVNAPKWSTDYGCVAFITPHGDQVLIPKKSTDLHFKNRTLRAFTYMNVEWKYDMTYFNYYKTNEKPWVVPTPFGNDSKNHFSLEYDQQFQPFEKNKLISGVELDSVYFAEPFENDKCRYEWGHSKYENVNKSRIEIKTFNDLPVKNYTFVNLNNCEDKIYNSGYVVPILNLSIIDSYYGKEKQYVAFVDPSGSYVLVPKDANNLTFKNGTLTQFTISEERGDKIWSAYLNGDYCIGYFAEKPNQDHTNFYNCTITEEVKSVYYIVKTEEECTYLIGEAAYNKDYIGFIGSFTKFPYKKLGEPKSITFCQEVKKCAEGVEVKLPHFSDNQIEGLEISSHVFIDPCGNKVIVPKNLSYRFKDGVLTGFKYNGREYNSYIYGYNKVGYYKSAPQWSGYELEKDILHTLYEKYDHFTELASNVYYITDIQDCGYRLYKAPYKETTYEKFPIGVENLPIDRTNIEQMLVGVGEYNNYILYLESSKLRNMSVSDLSDYIQHICSDAFNKIPYEKKIEIIEYLMDDRSVLAETKDNRNTAIKKIARSLSKENSDKWYAYMKGDNNRFEKYHQLIDYVGVDYCCLLPFEFQVDYIDYLLKGSVPFYEENAILRIINSISDSNSKAFYDYLQKKDGNGKPKIFELISGIDDGLWINEHNYKKLMQLVLKKMQPVYKEMLATESSLQKSSLVNFRIDMSDHDSYFSAWNLSIQGNYWQFDFNIKKEGYNYNVYQRSYGVEIIRQYDVESRMPIISESKQDVNTYNIFGKSVDALTPVVIYVEGSRNNSEEGMQFYEMLYDDYLKSEQELQSNSVGTFVVVPVAYLAYFDYTRTKEQVVNGLLTLAEIGIDVYSLGTYSQARMLVTVTKEAVKLSKLQKVVNSFVQVYEGIGALASATDLILKSTQQTETFFAQGNAVLTTLTNLNCNLSCIASKKTVIADLAPKIFQIFDGLKTANDIGQYRDQLNNMQKQFEELGFYNDDEESKRILEKLGLKRW